MRLLLLIALLVSSSTTARSSEPAPIDADGWVALVLNGDAGATLAGDADRARADANATGLWANPTLRLERQSGPLSDQSKGSQDFLAVELPIPLSGSRGLAKDAAVVRADAAVLDLRARRALLARDAIDVFVDVIGGARRVRALDEERARLAPVVGTARRRADAGESSTATALRLELELARVDDDVAAARAASVIALARAAAFVAGPLPRFVDALPHVKSSSSSPPSSLAALTKEAEAASLDEDAAARRVVPDLVVGGGPSLLNTGGADFAVGYLVTVGVELPLFDRGQGDAARARASRVAFDAERAAAARRVDAARNAAIANGDAARARVVAFGAAVDGAAGLFDAAAKDLAVGSGDVVAFVDAAAALRDARLRLVSLQEQSARADADLSLANGALESSPETP